MKATKKKLKSNTLFEVRGGAGYTTEEVQRGGAE